MQYDRRIFFIKFAKSWFYFRFFRTGHLRLVYLRISRIQNLHLQRLAHVAVHARIQAGLYIVGKDVGGHGNDGRALVRALALKGADAAGGLQTVHLGHHHVHKDGVISMRRGILHGLQRLLAVGHSGDLRALFLQQRHGNLGVQLVVLGQKEVQALQIRLYIANRGGVGRSMGPMGSDSRTMKVEPLPGSLSTSSEPCIWSTSFLVMAMPRPVPL